MGQILKITVTAEMKRSGAYQSAGLSISAEVLVGEDEDALVVATEVSERLRGLIYNSTLADVRDLANDAAALGNGNRQKQTGGPA